MKRFVVIAFMVMLVCVISVSALADEILFNSIPWGSDPFALERELDKMGLFAITSIDSRMMLYDARVDNTDMESGQWGGPVTEKVCGYITSGMDVIDSRDKYFNGLPVSTVSGYFVYGIKENEISTIKPDARLYAVQIYISVENVTETYDLLTKDYIDKYGEYKEKWGYSEFLDWDASIIDRCDMISRIFYGDNDTCVMIEKLIYKGSDKGIIISFGKLGFDVEIKKVEVLAK